MGQFSWLDCENNSQIVDNKIADVYVLVPKEFGGGHIHERCYDGYGNFGGRDVYELVADWNRKYLKEHPDFRIQSSIERIKYGITRLQESYIKAGMEIPENIKIPDNVEEYGMKVSSFSWYDDYCDLSMIKEEFQKKNGEYRGVGIDLACYDEDNIALPYPIKITHNPDLKYEDCKPSLIDPNQGWEAIEEEYY